MLVPAATAGLDVTAAAATRRCCLARHNVTLAYLMHVGVAEIMVRVYHVLVLEKKASTIYTSGRRVRVDTRRRKKARRRKESAPPKESAPRRKKARRLGPGCASRHHAFGDDHGARDRRRKRANVDGP